jgi:hypothetical protein
LLGLNAGVRAGPLDKDRILDFTGAKESQFEQYIQPFRDGIADHPPDDLLMCFNVTDSRQRTCQMISWPSVFFLG